MIGLLLALYPGPWRRRYGEEFRAVLESRPLGPFDVADVLLGALDARTRTVRITTSSEQAGGRLTMLRVGGAGAIAGGTLWAAGFVGASVIGGDTALWMLLLTIGTAGILLALVGLSAFQAHRDPRLAWAAFLIPGVGSIVSLIGLAGMMTMVDTDAPMLIGLSPWSIWAVGGLAALIGCALFAVATYRAAVLSRSGAIGLGASSFAMLVVVLGITSDSPVAGSVGILLASSLLVFAGSWALLGISALRRGPIRAVSAV